jgi:hypothetical protein
MTVFIIYQHGRASCSQPCPLVLNRQPAGAYSTDCVGPFFVSFAAYPFSSCSSSSSDNSDGKSSSSDNSDGQIDIVRDIDYADKINVVPESSDNEIVYPYRDNDYGDAGNVGPVKHAN